MSELRQLTRQDVLFVGGETARVYQHTAGLVLLDFARQFRAADHMAVLLRELDTGPVIAVGDSMGGAIAQYLWRQHPDLVSGLPGAGRLQ